MAQQLLKTNKGLMLILVWNLFNFMVHNVVNIELLIDRYQLNLHRTILKNISEYVATGGFS